MKSARLLAVLAVLVLSVGCGSGPRYLSTQVDDWRNKSYETDPLRTAVLTDVIPFYPILTGLAAIPDFLILNPIQFWCVDVWCGRGVAAMHDNPEGGKDPWFCEPCDEEDEHEDDDDD